MRARLLAPPSQMNTGQSVRHTKPHSLRYL